ncbi:hypothetical protein PGIGA_G00052550, partial [Pangasianodon gigas]|nr:hypothetical protein [Pangasianodon gigas]
LHYTLKKGSSWLLLWIVNGSYLTKWVLSGSISAKERFSCRILHGTFKAGDFGLICKGLVWLQAFV